MKIMHVKKPGFVIVLVLLMISVGMVLIVPLVNRVAGYNRLSTLVAEREQAKALALSGIEIAIAQLSMPGAEKDAQSNGAQASPLATPGTAGESDKALRDNCLKVCNHWQKFDLTHKEDGVDATCEIYIACEQGKINLNALYNFEKKEYVVRDGIDGKKIIEWIGPRIDELVGTQHFAENVTNFFKQRKKPLEDITELLSDPAFKNFIPCQWPLCNSAPEAASSKEQQIFLTDLLYVCGQDSTLEPLVLSRSFLRLLGNKQDDAVYTQKQKSVAVELKKMPLEMAWESQWDVQLAKFYDIEYTKVPESLRKLFAKKFELVLFSVISCVKIGNAHQKVCALLEKNVSADNQTRYIIKKLYWL